MTEISRTGAGWVARAGGEDVGRVVEYRRPDGRRFLVVRGEAARALLATAVAALDGDLHVAIDEADADTAATLAALGFEELRREDRFTIPVAAAVRSLAGAQLPPGTDLVTAARVPEDELRLLDDRLRQDVPGTDGWRWDAAGFREETYESAAYDPELYLVAVVRATGARVGIARVWNNPSAPRFGFVGVERAHRRQGLARAMTAAVLRVVHGRGHGEVVTEADVTNTASQALLRGLGARRTGGAIELVRAG